MSESPRPSDAEQADTEPSGAGQRGAGPADTEPPGAEQADAGHSTTPVAVAVVRSGGIAGLSRRWRVEIDASDSTDAETWIALIDRCPWNDDVESSTGADRYVWSIRARTPSERRERELPDAALSGAWRDLVDAVRAASA